VTRVAYLDLIGGVAGDMLMAALIDAGADRESMFRSIGTLGLQHRGPKAKPVTRGGIRGLHLSGTPATGQEPRTLAEILTIIERGDLAASIRERASEVFRRLVDAEARAHGVAPEAVTLHEAGDDDAIFDVVGVLLAVADLGIEEVVSSPVPLGGGRDRNGMSWPGPATLELLKGLPVSGPPPSREATTPTGAALVASLSTSFGSVPPMTLERTGYGAGTRDLPGPPNLVRVLIGERTTAPWQVEHGMRVIEANIDDLSPQLIASAAQALFAAGAADVWQTPIHMKRGRSAVTLSALAAGSTVDAIKATFFRETTTLGVRDYPVERAILEREIRTVEVRGEIVRVKVGRLDGSVVTTMPEHVDLERLAERTGVPVRELWLETIAATSAMATVPDPPDSTVEPGLRIRP
jgi:uncharacterized protein (TIGR00299 family) protein